MENLLANLLWENDSESNIKKGYCSCLRPLDHWNHAFELINSIQFSKKRWDQKCSVLGCVKDAEVGSQVSLVNKILSAELTNLLGRIGKEDIYETFEIACGPMIVPMCNFCSKKWKNQSEKDRYFHLKPKTLLVQPSLLPSCKKKIK